MGETYQARSFSSRRQLGRRPPAVAHVGAQDGAGVFQRIPGPAPPAGGTGRAIFPPCGMKGGEDGSWLRSTGPALEDGDGVKGRRYVRAGGLRPPRSCRPDGSGCGR